ncbi:hypothetical protein BZ17_708 [Yersinia pseudotuberculosis IP 32953]|uniref:Uncharacterized protein n=2 Tax=Yersinia pseudotuberculosis complex TaxID=1649845 RepID=Q66BI9_YERPS|nr:MULTISPECIES: hypothetical protein [Yersinia pseudotuberculosis complex]AJJ54434.1 hypothetical protein BZ17_708 [Yersinia pseudotuberculosis IP 32953]PSH43207.1 hypothetical protein BA193_12935 [Yersinia pseudotuberculosis]PSH45792.1 hypothetical protein BA194_17950 [Yersinia pseudotuberculosis]CAH21021.1 hypothetical [Yersinia pseudotuberculosis IP 32953]CND86549.1 Uncharacterised protein [Yersinia pseudotuberculosis]
MTTQATTASVLESSLRPVRAQLDLAIEQTTGTAQRSIESATVLLNQTQSLCIEQLNIETDEYNLLFDRLEKAENDLTTKSLALTHVQERIESADLVAAEANAQRDSISAKYNLSISDQRVLATEVNRLKSLNPEKMKIQIVRLKDELDNKRTLLNQQLTEIRRYKKEAAERTSKLAAMVNVNNQLANTVSDLTARIQRMDGDVEPTYYRGNDGTEFYFYTFQWGLKLRSGDYDMQLINDIDWHIEIRSTTGIGLIVSVNEWALPVYPMVDDFKRNWPDGLTPAVTQRIRDLLEPTHPHLVKRAEWAESVLTETLPLKEQYLELLARSGLHSLFDVVRRTPDMLANAVKGFGIASARQVHAQCTRIVKEWESEQKQKEAA